MKNMKKKKVLKKKYKILFMNFFLLLFFLIFLYSTYRGVQILYYSNQSITTQKEIVEEVTKVDEETEDTTIDFKRLKEINSHVVGWIQIPDTHINHPILKTTNNSYYLNHDIYNHYNINGSIYMNYQNDPNFTDANTILFGHYTHSTEMFSDLKKIYDENRKNVTITIYREEEKITYTVYQMYVTDPDDEEPLNIGKSLFEKEDFNIDLKNDEIRQTLTLSTCYNNGAKRLIIHAYRNLEAPKEE